MVVYDTSPIVYSMPIQELIRSYAIDGVPRRLYWSRKFNLTVLHIMILKLSSFFLRIIGFFSHTSC